jgi:hypothetical protein
VHSDGVDDLTAAIATLTAGAYGRSAADENGLDEALDRGERGVRRVARQYTVLARAVRAARRSVSGVRDRAWAR